MMPEVAASAQFGGLSGGSITSTLTAIGHTGTEMWGGHRSPSYCAQYAKRWTL